MKKTILGMMMLITGVSLFAQEPTVVRMQTTSSNAAYSIPDPVRVSFETSYPEAVMTTWEPSGEWWRATYRGDRKINHVYYAATGYYANYPSTFFTVALPVINTYVPDEVVSSAIDKYGSRLYSITQMKGTEGIYQVRLLDHGIAENTWMNASGTVLTDADVFKVKTDDDKTKIKADDEKMKIKADEQK
jgi:hypothetical protein